MAAAGDEPWCQLDFDFSERSMVSVAPKKYTIGRHPRNDQVEADERVSAFHCQLLFKERGEGLAEVKDTSTYGTFINGKKIGKDNVKPVTDGDVIAVILGEPTLIFTFRDRRPVAGQPSSGKPAMFEASGSKVVPNLPPPEESIMASRFGPASSYGSIPAPIPALQGLQGSYAREDLPPPAPPLDPPPPDFPPPPLAPAFAESDTAVLSALPSLEETAINYGHKEGETVGYAAC
mmetsp:Transcript_1859/g.4157  ORF Transcript_1859/g.4157 Transcript_1859/m.4157 type:complete len:234 (-) Transcript_1859:371-1072(-)